MGLLATFRKMIDWADIQRYCDAIARELTFTTQTNVIPRNENRLH